MAISAWIPDRKVLAGGIVGVVVFYLTQFIPGLELGLEATAAISLGIAKLVEYFVPPSVANVINKIDGTLRKLGVDPAQSDAIKVAKVKAGV